MRSAGQLILLFVIAALSYTQRFLWFLFKVFLGVGIAWGMLRSLDPFPAAAVSQWQRQLLSEEFGIPGEKYLEWVASNWLVTVALVLIVLSVRSYRIVSVVGQTSGHAAYVASALANYLDIEPTTLRLLKLQREPTRGFFDAIIKEGLYSRVMSIFGGVPFLPDEAISGRKGVVVSYRDDFREYLSKAETDTSPLDRIMGSAKTTASTSRFEFGWDNDREGQELWVQVESWQYKVFVSSLKTHSALFQFDGIASEKSGLKGLRVDGEVAVPLEILHPESDEPLPNDRGDLFLIDGTFGPYLHVILRVGPETFAELSRVFSGECAGKNDDLGLKLCLQHGKGAEPGFWHTDWQKETIQISDFGLYTGGRFKRYARLPI